MSTLNINEAITATTEDYVHSKVDSVTFIGNAQAWGNARYVNGKNILEMSPVSESSNQVNFVSYENNIIPRKK